MKFLKCVSSASTSGVFTVNQIYPVLESRNYFDDRLRYVITDNNGIPTAVPLDGQVWRFVEYTEEAKDPKPRYHHKRKPVPKRTVTTAKIYYNDGSTYTVKHVDKVVCYGGKVSMFGRQDVTEGIEDSRLVKIDARLLRNIVVKSPSQVTQIERDFIQGDKWNVYRKTEQIFRAAQIDIEV